MTRLRATSTSTRCALGIALLLLISTASHSQNFDTFEVPSILCGGSIHTVSLDEPLVSGYQSFLGFLHHFGVGGSSIQVEQQVSGQTTVQWVVPDNAEPMGGYRFGVVYFERDDESLPLNQLFFSNEFEIADCGPSTDLVSRLEAELRGLRELPLFDWERTIPPRVPPLPLCRSCPYYLTEAAELFSTLDRARVEGTVAVKVTDKKNRTILDFGELQSGKYGFSDHKGSLPVEGVVRLAKGRSCGLNLVISQPGRWEASVDICIEVVN